MTHNEAETGLLRRAFDLLHAGTGNRELVPPFFVFRKYPTKASARSVQFKGLAAPGFPSLPATSDLVAVWKTAAGQRFQNYRAVFTVLDVPVISRAWLPVLSPVYATVSLVSSSRHQLSA